MDWDKMPKWLGYNYTSHIHSKPSGPTLPENNLATTPLVVLITGAGKGLGLHVTLSYARANASSLIITSRTQSDLDNLEAQIKQINPNCNVLSVVCDTTSHTAMSSLATKIQEKFGRLDIVIANAGIISAYLPDGSLPTKLHEDTDFARVININLTGTAITAQTMLPLLIASPPSSTSPETGAGAGVDSAKTFIAITSLAGLFPQSAPTTTAYNVSKIAVNRLVELIASDYADEGVLAYSIHPGAVVTPQTQHHSTQEGDMWESALTDSVELCGGFCTWLTKERRSWGSGRYFSANWDVEELEEKALREGWGKGEKRGNGEGGLGGLRGGDQLKMRLWV